MILPYLYRKIVKMFADNNGKSVFKLPELQNELIKLRISKHEALVIAKELEKQGIVVLDVGKGTNQHLKIRVCNKSMAKILTLLFGYFIFLYGAWLSILICGVC